MTPLEVLSIAFVMLLLGLGIVTAMKGKWFSFAIGFLGLNFVWFFTGLRLAKPNSYWARHFYSHDKLRRAAARSAKPSAAADPPQA
jgi:hypothetical protein